mgnify:CR=1 FL=1
MSADEIRADGVCRTFGVADDGFDVGNFRARRNEKRQKQRDGFRAGGGDIVAADVDGKRACAFCGSGDGVGRHDEKIGVPVYDSAVLSHGGADRRLAAALVKMGQYDLIQLFVCQFSLFHACCSKRSKSEVSASSFITATPSFSAFVSLLPAFSPATT